MIWDVSVRKTFKSSSHTFSMDVTFCSHQPALVLFGPSGAGKSQTLKMIAGLERPDGGHIQVGGRLVFSDGLAHSPTINLTPQQRKLIYVFQDYALFPHLTVLQNIAFARRRGWLNPRRSQYYDDVTHWMRLFRLDTVAHLLPSQISGGQRQRTALARALVAQPHALLLDEPFAALDRDLRTHLRRELAAIQADLRLPLMLITHDEEDIEYFSDAVVHMQDGHVIEATSV